MAESSRTVLFVGTHVHEPNRDGMNWFLDNCWAVLRERCPGAGLRIVGQGDWAALGAGRGHLSGVDYVGRVDDLAAEYAAARVCICPVREGGGSKIKLIEAAGFGRPIVSTSHALRGFDAEISGHAAAADAPEDFVAACAHYLEDADLAAASGAALRKAQQAHHSRAAALDRIAADMDRALVRQAELSGRSAGT
jgi:glycosyltransferase involved in cell wall biosynthesis